MFGKILNNTRGQVFTLEGVVGSIIIISAIAFALQATALTPLSSSTANIQVEEQGRILAGDMIDTASDDGAAIDAILYYNSDEETYGDGVFEIRGHPSAGPPNTDFQQYQEDFLVSQGYTFNIDIAYENEDGDTDTESMINQGRPSGNAVTVTRTFMLYDDMENTQNGETLAEDDQFFAPNQDPDSELYNVVEVKITIWKV